MATGYGSDIWCADSMVTARLDSGSGFVARALYRRLITPRGTLRGGPDEDAYGFDVASYAGRAGLRTATIALPGIVRAELIKDDRVADVSVTVTESATIAAEISLVLTIRVVLVADTEDFTFTVGVNDVTVEFLGYEVAA